MTTAIGATPQISRITLVRTFLALPSPLANTLGAPVPMVAFPPGVRGVYQQALAWQPNYGGGGVGGESLSLSVVYVWDDNTTTVFNSGSSAGNAANGNTAISGGRAAAWVNSRDMHYITNITVAAQSSIANSLASPFVTIVLVPVA